jgi:hypothetical protein
MTYDGLIQTIKDVYLMRYPQFSDHIENEIPKLEKLNLILSERKKFMVSELNEMDIPVNMTDDIYNKSIDKINHYEKYAKILEEEYGKNVESFMDQLKIDLDYKEMLGI